MPRTASVRVSAQPCDAWYSRRGIVPPLAIASIVGHPGGIFSQRSRTRDKKVPQQDLARARRVRRRVRPDDLDAATWPPCSHGKEQADRQPVPRPGSRPRSLRRGHRRVAAAQRGGAVGLRIRYAAAALQHDRLQLVPADVDTRAVVGGAAGRAAHRPDPLASVTRRRSASTAGIEERGARQLDACAREVYAVFAGSHRRKGDFFNDKVLSFL